MLQAQVRMPILPCVRVLARRVRVTSLAALALLPALASAATWWEAYEAPVGDDGVHFRAEEAPTAEGVQRQPASPDEPLTFSESDRLVVPHNDALDLPAPLTIEVWCKPEAHSGYALLRKHAFGFPAFLENGEVSWYLYANGRDHSSRVAGIAELGQWHHYCLTFDGEQVVVFHDGGEVMSRPLRVQLNTPSAPVMIGFSDGWAGKFVGQIGVVRLYDAVLSPEQVAANYQRLRDGLPLETSDRVVLEKPVQPRRAFEQSLAFDGETGATEAQLPESAQPKTALAVGAWVKPADTGGTAPLVAYGDGRGAGVQVSLRKGALEATVRTTDGVHRLRHPDCVEPGRWQNVGLAWDGRAAQLFANGKPVGKPGLVTGELIASRDSVLVGADPTRANHFAGEVAEARLLARCAVTLPALPAGIGEQVTVPAGDEAQGTPPGPRSRHLEGKQEKHPPLLDFEDMHGWQVSYPRGITTAKLGRSREQRCWGEHVAKAVYGGGEYQGLAPKVHLKPPAPIRVGREFDAIDLWTYPHSWGNAQGVAMTVHLRDAEGNDHQYDLSANPRWFYWTGWYLAHRKLPRAFDADTLFTGFTLHSFTDKPDQVLYFDSLAFYTEDRSPLESHVPSWDALPTPTTEDTILPSLEPGTEFTNRATREGNAVTLTYNGPRDTVEWLYEPTTGTLSDLRVRHNGGTWSQPTAAGGLELTIDDETCPPDSPEVTRTLRDLSVDSNTVKTKWQWQVGETKFPVEISLTSRQKSLIIDVRADTELVSEVQFGRYEGASNCKLVRVPYFDIRGFKHKSEDPAVVCTDAFFLSGMQDWYNSQGSELFGQAEQLGPGTATYNGGVAYFPKTDGRRNAVRERFFLTLSSKFAEVLPNIPNPPSPYLESTKSGFWITRPWYMSQETYEAIQKGEQPPYYDQECDFWGKLHGYGVRDLLIRRHVAIYRQYLPMNGDPYTFVATTDPRCGGDAACAAHVRTIQDLGYRVGFYTNYTIISPLSYDIFSENMVCFDSNDEWQTGSLSTAMAKVSQVLPLQQRFASELKRRFGVSCSYQDQITCRPFWGCTDYDRRVEGAGTHSAVFRVYAKLLDEERKLYDGPVLSEGACHWYFAGLCDSNYAQTTNMDQPGLVDFQLLKLHPLNNDCGAEIAQQDPDRLAAYCLANGTVGHYSLSGHPQRLLAEDKLAKFLKAYFTIHSVQPHYAGVLVREIRYADAAGQLLTTEDAIRADAVKAGRVRVVYENGLTIHSNLGRDTWSITAAGRELVLPHNGYSASLNDKLIVYHALIDGHPAHYAESPERIYVDGNGTKTDFGPVVASGAYALLKGEGAPSLMPAPFRETETVTVRPNHLGVKREGTLEVTGQRSAPIR